MFLYNNGVYNLVLFHILVIIVFIWLCMTIYILFDFLCDLLILDLKIFISLCFLYLLYNYI